MNKTRILIFLAAALAVGAASAQPGPRADRGPRGERAGGPMPPEMREQMKADMRAIRELGRAARAETDETKKKEAVEQLRAKLGEVADRIQAHQEERLAQAEERLGELKARIEDGKVRRGERIDEQIDQILSGERPPNPEAFKDFPYAKGGKGPRPGGRGGPGFGGYPPEDAPMDGMDDCPPED